MSLPSVAITSGEPAGVGPELCVQLLRQTWPVRPVVIGDVGLLQDRLVRSGVHGVLRPYVAGQAHLPGVLDVLHVPLSVPAQAGKLDVAHAPYVLALLERAVQGCLQGEFAAMVTAPVHKGIICDAGVPFTGHTEFLAERTATPRVVMMLVGGGMRVALATTHLPLSQVATSITPALLEETLRILDADLRRRFGLPNPRILVAGLNPHAGEGGHMGDEELRVINPTLERLRAQGMTLIGPLPADTLFVPHTLKQGDAVLAMFHDQGLPVLKHASFGGGVNVTLGMPIIRTSVDHGTALDLAGSGRADHGSLFAALELAASLVAGGMHG